MSSVLVKKKIAGREVLVPYRYRVYFKRLGRDRMLETRGPTVPTLVFVNTKRNRVLPTYLCFVFVDREFSKQKQTPEL